MSTTRSIRPWPKESHHPLSRWGRTSEAGCGHLPGVLRDRVPGVLVESRVERDPGGVPGPLLCAESRSSATREHYLRLVCDRGRFLGGLRTRPPPATRTQARRPRISQRLGAGVDQAEHEAGSPPQEDRPGRSAHPDECGPAGSPRCLPGLRCMHLRALGATSRCS